MNFAISGLTHGQQVNTTLHVTLTNRFITARSNVDKKVTHSWLHMKLT